MSLRTEKLRDHLEGDYPIDVVGIYINRSGVRIQYREKSGDDSFDRQLRKARLLESVESFMKKAAYMDGRLDRNSKMMLQLESSDVSIAIQRVSNNTSIQTPDEYRIRQDIIRNTEDQYIFATKYFSIDCKEVAELTVETLRKHTCSDSEKKYILELQHLDASNQYTAYATFHTGDSYSSIMASETSN